MTETEVSAVSAYSDIAANVRRSASVLRRFRHLENPEEEDLEFSEKMQQGIKVLKLLQEGRKKFGDSPVRVAVSDLDHIKMFEIGRAWMAENAAKAGSTEEVLRKMLKKNSRENLSGGEIDCAIHTLGEIADIYSDPPKPAGT